MMEVESSLDANAASVHRVRDAVHDAIANKPHLQMFCSDRCILRFLKARSMDSAKAASMLLETLQWREEFRMHELQWQDIADQAATGKVMIANFLTHDGRPILILRPHHENNTKDQRQNIRHFAYQMEMITRMADRLEGDGKIVTIIDYDKWTLRKSPPMKTTLATLKIMQHHYPETLHLCLSWHPPAAFSVFWKLVTPFIDPVTAAKVLFIPKAAKDHDKLAGYVDTSQLDAGMGGSQADVYDREQWGERLMKEDKLYQDELEAYIASGKAAVAQSAA